MCLRAIRIQRFVFPSGTHHRMLLPIARARRRDEQTRAQCNMIAQKFAHGHRRAKPI